MALSSVLSLTSHWMASPSTAALALLLPRWVTWTWTATKVSTGRELAAASEQASGASGDEVVRGVSLCIDVAIGAPWSGDGGRGQVFIYLGKESGLSPMPTQVIDSPQPGRTAFGFALRGGVDIDGNGFPGVLEADQMSVIINQ